MDRQKLSRKNWLIRSIRLCAFALALWIMGTGRGLTDGSFGPGAYYYTDIPDWQTRIYSPASLSVADPGRLTVPALLLSLAAAGILLWLLLRVGRSERPQPSDQQ